MYKSLLLLLFSFFISNSFSQTYTIKGKVTDAETGEGIPFANVYPQNNLGLGKTTDFDGYYSLQITDLKDSIIVSYIGYIKRTKIIDATKKDEAGNINLNFQLQSDIRKLSDIVVVAGEDPSYPIMRKVLENKDKNDKRRLEEFEYESYVKIEIDLDNITDQFSKRKVIRDVRKAVDSLGGLTGEDGKSLIPLFLSETISKYYYQKSPERVKEYVIKTKVDGVGFDEKSTINQLLGSSFQEYNFYKNWMKILEKDFVSPIADGWKIHYDYYLADSMQVGEHWCYKIEVYPKREADLAFEGIIWIDSKSFALKQIDVSVGKKANINFIEKIKIQQELAPTSNGAWLPIKTRVLLDIVEVTKQSAGVIAKFYTSNKDIVLDKKYPIKFFNERLETAMDAKQDTDDYFLKTRHDSLTPVELQTLNLIDSIKQVPIVKRYSDVLYILSTGYFTKGPIDIGNYVYTYAWNTVEGHRLRLGFKTNEDFSKKFEFKGYGAYGFTDKRFKYSARLRYIPSRKHWTEIGIQRREEISQAAVNPDGVAVSEVFLSSLTFFNVDTRSPFFKKENIFYVQSDIFKGFTQTVRFRNYELEQIGNHFTYFTNPNGTEPLQTERNLTTSELTFETRLAKDEQFFYVSNDRNSLGTAKLPVVTLRYTKGLKGFLNGGFDYDKFAIAFEQSLRLGLLGTTYYLLTATYTPSTIPYPFLEVHLGNRGYFYNFYGYGLMNFLEFVSDRHVSLNLEHNLHGLISNRVPLLKKLKWRTFVATNLLYGSLRQENRAIIPIEEGIIRPKALDRGVYAEVGYGLNNVFKFFRITFLHRLTYLDRTLDPNIRKFSIFISARFAL